MIHIIRLLPLPPVELAIKEWYAVIMEQGWKIEICPVCTLPVKDCICCPE
jgi:hypothetical protein